MEHVDIHSLKGGLALAMLVLGTVLVLLAISEYILVKQKRDKKRKLDSTD